MHQASEVMRRNVEFCTPETVTPDVLYLIRNHNYDDLLVVNDMREFRLVGIVHASSVSNEALKNVVHPFQMRAKNFMDAVPPTVEKKTSVEECMKIMTENKLSLLPVIDENGKCCGIVKKSDLMNYDD